ncbi:hypothetical protein GCG54_00014005 [Colletotrichum gloeosporioides]|uniref:Tat pathway signal sequence n=1 Tax=Colletotrichum gloeosporioides TaxID=474922 RepID=A0A8H4CFC4_COLGL|nr:uncharacterized protein GCG54_00014005 [Colletotrichum gloeosporioides]KAF3802771.1 hypothetical protein GCG54_00014005 [Colletotrichum gloeosporioides]
MILNTYRGFTNNTEAQYAPLDKDCGEEDGIELATLDRHDHTWTTKQVIKIFTVTHLIVFSMAAGFWFLWREQPINKSLKDISFYSPLLDRIDIPYVLRFDQPQTIKGGNGDMTWGSQPNPEIDKMWEGITTEATIPVTAAEIISMRKDPSVAVMLPKEYHIDNEQTYLAHALVFHRLHCLDYIRKALYKDYYYPNGTEQLPMHGHHIAHCLAMILDHITCAGDPGLYIYQWYEHTEIPLPDANTWGKCWDFGAFRNNFDKIALKNFSPFDLRKPDGVKSVTEQNNLQEIIYQTRNPKPNPHL